MILAHIVIALIVTIFVFSGYWQKVKDQPAGMRFLNALVYWRVHRRPRCPLDILGAGGNEMNSFNFNDAVGFRLATQQEDTNAKVQVFIGVFLGVTLRWIYNIAGCHLLRRRH